ncbi:MAG TPA: dienelactone hydrolase family protein [Chloroflexota bacterium]|nr:dienelactone hydrolase family protein [Chloroflexota bacterium]
MNDIERYVIEEFVEEYQLGQYGYEELRRRLINCGADLSVLDNLPLVHGRSRPAMFAGGDNPWLDGGQEAEGSMTTYKSGSDSLEAYVARPKSQGPKPGVVVCHENKGLVDYVKDVAMGLASHGYVAIAPDLLTREGPTHKFGNPEADVPPLLTKIPPERHIADLKAAVDHLIGMNVGPIGAIGFCFGGGQTWRLATQEPRLAAAVPFYGPNPPLDDVPKITGPVLAIYGGLDERINAGIDAIKAAMEQNGKTFSHTVYPNSQHAFHNHTNPDRYNAETAKEAWQQATAWFKRYLG